MTHYKLKVVMKILVLKSAYIYPYIKNNLNVKFLEKRYFKTSKFTPFLSQWDILGEALRTLSF